MTLPIWATMSTYHVLKLPNGTIIKAQSANTRRISRRSFTWEDPVWLSWTATAAVLLEQLMRRAILIAVPYVWLLALFLVPFFIVLKISLSDTELAIPPYTPTLDLSQGGPGYANSSANWISKTSSG